jgi:hypothetical protein
VYLTRFYGVLHRSSRFFALLPGGPVTSVIIKSPGSGIVWRDVPPGVLRKILRPGLGLHPPTTRPGEEETPAVK